MVADWNALEAMQLQQLWCGWAISFAARHAG
jgi:hypothetical protein